MIVADTHAVIWMTQEPRRLSRAARQTLLAGRDQGALAIADITLREIAWLISTGRILVDKPLSVYLTFVESLFKVLPITAGIAEQSLNFSAAYPKDPADRLIGATTVVHRGTLVTRDGPIRASGEVNCVW